MLRSPLALAIVLLPCATQAEEIAPESLDALKSPYLVGTSGRSLEPRSQATAATSVFTRADIARLKVKSLPDLLARVPGMSVQQTGGRGSPTALYLRGTNPSQVLVLLDGMRIGQLSNGLARLQYLNMQQVERVEVTRGARSSLYGGNAMGGVIQVFTRRGKAGLDPRFDFSLGDGDDSENSLGLAGGDANTRYDLGMSLVELRQDRSDDRDGANTDKDAYRNRGLNLSLEHRFAETWRAGLNLLDQRGKSELDGDSGAFPDQPRDRFALSSTSAFLQVDPSPLWSSRLEAGHSEDKSRVDTVYNYFTTFEEYASYRDSLLWQNTLHLDAANQLLLGAEWTEERLRANVPLEERERRNQAWFFQHRYRAAPFGTELGLRHDQDRQFGNEDSLNAALDIDLPAQTQLVLSYAEGFRTPTFLELYVPKEFFPSGNPDLQPERSRTWEAQLRGNHLGTDWSLGVYRTDIRDLITDVETFDPDYARTWRNVGRARINGLDISLSRELLGWTTRLSAGFVDPRDRETGHTLPGRSRRNLALDMDRRFGEYSFGFSWLGVSSRYQDADNTVHSPGYGRLDIRAGWDLLEGLKVETRVENLGDNRYLEKRYADQSGFSSSPYGDALPYENNDVYIDDPTYEARGGYRDAGRRVVVSLKWSPQF